MRIRSLLPLTLLAAVAGCSRGKATTAPVPSTPGAPGAAGAGAIGAYAVADSFRVRFSTTKGEFDVIVRKAWSPLGAARMRELVEARYYDGNRFFRALRGFIVQWGIAPESAQTAAWRGKQINDDPVTESNRRGTVVFAKGGANTRTTHLFINLRDNARLDALGFSPIGEVVGAGMDVVDSLHTGYGEGQPAGNGPPQNKLAAGGEAYLAKEFPLLDKIRSARIVQMWAPNVEMKAP